MNYPAKHFINTCFDEAVFLLFLFGRYNKNQTKKYLTFN